MNGSIKHFMANSNQFQTTIFQKHLLYYKIITMNKFIFPAFIAFSIAGCVTATKQSSGSSDTKIDSEQEQAMLKDTTPKVTGIGGIFFRSKDPQKIKDWYGENLGLAIDDYGSPFEFRNANRPDEINYLRWSPFDETSEYLDPSKKDFMINYRVQNIEGLVKKLRGNGVTIVDEISSFEYGKFVHIMDPEGNKVELWEPIDSFLTQLGGKTTK